MRCSTVAAAAATSLLAIAQAGITGFAVPSSIELGSKFDVVICSSDFIQSIYDVAIAFAYQPVPGYPESIGVVIDSFYLGPSQSNQGHNFNQTITIPKSAPKGSNIMSASLMSLLGAESEPVLANFNVTVTFGDHFSEQYVSSSNL